MSTYSRYVADGMRHSADSYARNVKRYDEHQSAMDKARNAFESGTGDVGLDSISSGYYNQIAEKVKQEQDAAQAERDSMNAFERVGHTLGDFFGSVVTGVGKSVEGMVDYFAGWGGEKNRDFIAKDYTHELLGKHIENGTKGSYMRDNKAGEIARNVASGVGGMLPAVAAKTLDLVAPGVGTALSTGMFMTGAGGQSVEQSLNDGASMSKAMLYGSVSGALEGGIEALSGGIGGIGKTIGKSAVKSGVKGGAKKFLKNMVGEGLEEVTSDLLAPVTKSIYTNNVDYSTVKAKGLLDTFTVGALTGGVMQGGQKLAVNSNSKMYIQDKLGELKAQENALDERYNVGKLTQEQYVQGMEDISWLRDKTVSRYNKMRESSQNKILAKFGGENANENLYNYGLQSTADGMTRLASEGEYSNTAYSPSLKGKEDKLIYKPTQEVLTTEESSEIQKASKLLNSNNTKIVVTDDIPMGDGSANGAYKDGVLYVRRGSDVVSETVKHEFTHSLEGSNAYSKFVKYVSRTVSSDPELAKRYGDMGELASSIRQGYAEQGVELEDTDVAKEVIAKYASEKLFTDAKQINRLTRSSKAFSGRVLAFIRDSISRMGGKNTNSLKFLRNAERLYANAMRKSDIYAQQRKNTATTAVQFDKTKTFAEQVDDVITGGVDYQASHLKLGNTPEVLVKLGFAQLPMLMTKKHVVTMTQKSGNSKGNYHDLGIELLKQFPSLIENPIAVFKSATDENSVVMVLDAKDKESRQIVASVRKDGQGKYNNVDIDANILTSGYGKDDFVKFVSDNVNAGRVMLYDMKKRKDVFTRPQLQLLNTSKIPFFTSSISNTAMKSNSLEEESLKSAEKTTKNAKSAKDTNPKGQFSLDLDRKKTKKPTNISNLRVYSKADAEAVVDKFMNNHMTFGDKYADLPSAARRQVENIIWNDLNKVGADRQAKSSLDIADFVIANSIVENVYEVTDTKPYKDIINTLKPYLHTINLDSIKGDIKHRYGDDKGVYARWGRKKNANGHTADQVGAMLSGSGLHLESETAAGILFEIDDAYVKAREGLAMRGKPSLGTVIDKAEIKKARQDIAKEIMLAYDQSGSLTATAKKIDKLEHTVSSLKTANADIMTKLDTTTNELVAERKRKNKKAYTRADCRAIVNEVLRVVDSTAETVVDDKSEIVEKLNRQLNDEQLDVAVPARTTAKWIIDNAYSRSFDADANENAEDIIELYKTHVAKKFNLTAIKDEIVKIFGIKRYQSLTAEDGANVAELDMIVPAMEELGIVLPDSPTAADIFSAMYINYNNALDMQKSKDVKLKDNEKYKQGAEYQRLLRRLTESLQNAFTKYGNDTPLYREVSGLQNIVAELKNKNKAQEKLVKDEKLINKYTNGILDNTRLFRDMKKKGISADIPKDQVTDSLLDVLGRVVMRSHVNRVNANNAIKCLKAFYTVDRIGLDVDTQLIDMINELDANFETADLRKRDMNLRQLELLDKVLSGVRTYIRTSDSVVIDGVQVSARAEAQKGITIINQNASMLKKHRLTGFISRLINKFTGLIDPTAVFALADGNHKDGAMTHLWQGIKDSETNQKALYIELLTPFDKFFAKKPSVIKRLRSEYVIDNVAITREHAITLLLTSRRNQAEGAIFGVDANGKHYEGGGFRYEKKNGVTCDVAVTKEDLKNIEKSLTEDELEYIKIIEEFFNVRASNVKRDADYKYCGYTNVTDSYYFSIARDDGDIAKRYADAREYVADFQNVYSFSMNKNVVPNARNAIRLLAVSDIVADHAKKVSIYATMTESMKTFDRVMNSNVNKGDPTKTILTLRNTLDKEHPKLNKYILDIMQDLQGANRQRTTTTLAMAKNGYIKGVLGFNPKTWLSQLAGIPAAMTYLSPASVAKGFGMKFDKKMYDKYSKYGLAREYNRTSIRAEGLTGKISKAGDVYMKPISMVDDYMMHHLWNACRAEVAKKQGLELDTEANYKAAAKLYEFVARSTQSNDSMSEKSALGRSESEIARTFTMFKSDALKQLSRLVEHLNAVIMTNLRVREGLATRAELKKAKRQLVRSATSFALSNAVYVAIGLLFSCMLRKRDKDGKPWDADDYGKAFGMGMLDSIVGIFPVVSDIFDSLLSGFDIEHFSYGMLNDLVGGTKGVFTVLGKAMKGESVTEADGIKAIRDILTPLGMAFGIPMKNLIKYPKMIVGWISPSAVYKYDSMFYPQHTQALNAAIADGDEKLAKNVIKTMYLRDKGGADLNVTALDEIYRLYALSKKDKDINFSLASSIPKTVKYTDEDGNAVEKKLNAQERKKFLTEYAKVSKSINELVNSAEYKSANDILKSKLIRSLYDYYYEISKSQVSGVNNQKGKTALVKLLGGDVAVTILSQVSEITPDTFPNGKTRPNSRRRKILALLGKYQLSAIEREYVLVACGYAPNSKRAFASRIKNSQLTPEEKEYYLDKVQ